MARIMIVDDASLMRMILRNLFSEQGHEVIAEAENGKEAVTKYRNFKPDLVTMDISMPEFDGIQATRDILTADPKAKIVICSSVAQHNMVLDAIKAGAKDFILKPIIDDRIMSAIQRILSL